MEKIEYFSSVLRIKNPRTLQKWISKGWYQDELSNGWVFNVGCGRFKRESCTCCKCRKPGSGKKLQIVIDRYYKPNKNFES